MNVIKYDYLIIASGSQTNFYGQNEIRISASKLDAVEDARRILDALQADLFKAFVISGGGYTGIEIAGNLWLYFRLAKIDKKIVIVELAADILGPVPSWMKDYIRQNLRRLGIEVVTEAKAEKVEQNKIYLSNGRCLEQAMLIWASGVKTADFISRLNAAKDRQGRIKVDEYLRINDYAYAVGDAAQCQFRGKPLRMAVQFSIAQGRLAAENILRQIKRRPLKKYRPLDLGYVIPMANNKSCGRILGLNLKGLLPTLLHYTMCVYRLLSWRNRLAIIRDLILPR